MVDSRLDSAAGRFSASVRDQANRLREGLSDIRDQANRLREESANRMREGLSDVRDSANRVREGLSDVRDSANRLCEDSANRLREGLSDVRHSANRLREDSVNRLREGLSDVRDSASRLREGLSDVRDSANRLREGAADFMRGRAKPAAGSGGTDEEAPPSDDLRKAVIVGLAIVGIFYGGFGTWAVTAPLNSAVVAQAVVKVQGNRKSVQHLDGGIVKELRVKEGDHVKEGEVLVVLDDNQARAEFVVLSQQYLVLRATEVRLLAELAHAPQLVMTDDLQRRKDRPYFQAIWSGQVSQFESRRAALNGQTSVIQEKINQLQSQIVGAQAQVKSLTDEITSVNAEAASIAPLVEKNLLPRPRLLQLQRNAFQLEGQIADARASIAKFKQAIAEQQQQIAQLDNDRMTDVTKDLRETQAKLLEVIPKRVNAEAVLGRMEIRSPYAGRVVALNVFSLGGVIQRGDKILDIVPDDDGLTIEAQVAVEDISDVHPDMKAEVHLTAYKQRIVPMVRGVVTQVSADRLTDPKSEKPYYTVQVQLDANDLAGLPQVKLYPGMPATVMVPTESRTAFDYLVGPLTMSFKQAFRQK